MSRVFESSLCDSGCSPRESSSLASSRERRQENWGTRALAPAIVAFCALDHRGVAAWNLKQPQRSPSMNQSEGEQAAAVRPESEAWGGTFVRTKGSPAVITEIVAPGAKLVTVTNEGSLVGHSPRERQSPMQKLPEALRCQRSLGTHLNGVDTYQWQEQPISWQ